MVAEKRRIWISLSQFISRLGLLALALTLVGAACSNGDSSTTSGIPGTASTTTTTSAPTTSETTTSTSIVPSTTSSSSPTTTTPGPIDNPELGDESMTGLERIAVLELAYERLAVEQCCGEDPGVGSVGLLGFRNDGVAVFVESGPFRFTVAPHWGQLAILIEAEPALFTDSEQALFFFCDHSWYKLEILENTVPPPDPALELASALGCSA